MAPRFFDTHLAPHRAQDVCIAVDNSGFGYAVSACLEATSRDHKRDIGLTHDIDLDTIRQPLTLAIVDGPVNPVVFSWQWALSGQQLISQLGYQTLDNDFSSTSLEPSTSCLRR